MTGRPDEEDRLRELFAGPPAYGDAVPGCPPPDILWQARDGGLEPEARRAIIAHTAACAECAEAWRVAGDLGAGEQLETTAAVRRAWLPAVGVAAAILLATGLFVMRHRFSPGGGGGEEVMRSGEQLAIRSLTPEDRPAPRSGLILSWTPGPEGTRYDVSVATADLEVIARGRGLNETRFEVPEIGLRELPAGASLIWRVEARLPDGSVVVSPAFLVRLE